jgi:hypothetical protein
VIEAMPMPMSFSEGRSSLMAFSMSTCLGRSMVDTTRNPPRSMSVSFSLCVAMSSLLTISTRYPEVPRSVRGL